MKNENININEFGENSPQDEIVLKDLLILLFQKRAWFILSFVVMMTLGILYVKTKPNIYSRTATVIVEDERRGGSVSEAAVFQEIFSMGGGSVYNEMGLFNSNRLMYEVVDRLNLEIGYRIREKLRTKELYKLSPINVVFSEIIPTQAITFGFTMISSAQAKITDLTFHDRITSRNDIILEDQIVNIGEMVVTPYGQFKITPTLFMSDVYIGETIFVSRFSPKAVARMYNKALNVVLIDKYASLLTISISDESVDRAEDIINTLIQVYSDDAIDDKNRILTNTSSFIEDRLAIIEADLTDVDAEIENYKRENKLMDGVMEGTMHLESVNRIDQENLNVLNQLSMAQYMKAYLEDDANTSALLPVNVGITNAGLQQQVAEYNEYMNRRNKLLLNSSANNPLVIDMQNVLVSMRSSVLLSIDNLIASLEIQAANFARKERENLSKIADIPSQQKYIISVERQQTIKEQLYLYLLNKKEESELQRSITESNCRIVDVAEGDDRPVAPNKKMIIVFCFFLGLLIPAAVIYVMSIFNTSVKNRKDIKDTLTIPFLGDIPLEVSTKKSSHGIVVEADGRTPACEAFKIIRDNIDFMQVDDTRKHQVFQLTSMNPGSGKTFITTNLAMSMALGGSKVVIVDLDIRKGTLSKESGIGIKQIGVTQYLAGRVDDVKEIIRQYADTQFDIISSGALPLNPSELLKSKRLEALITELRGMYDYIFIDNPPYGVVVDAAICARLCDQSIYIIRAQNFDKRLLPDIQELFDREKLPNMSTLLNGVDYKANRYIYGYGYGYGDTEEVKQSWIKRLLGI